ncbi:hypothetical protein [Mariniflexile sp.]|uniref:hypothetical protein n=1 Tax=Mariniflexile sp. TaxID=1979402 RepID=UPI0040489D01
MDCPLEGTLGVFLKFGKQTYKILVNGSFFIRKKAKQSFKLNLLDFIYKLNRLLRRASSQLTNAIDIQLF